MHVLLLGASGFIGSAIGRALLAKGHEVRALGRDVEFGRRILPAAEWVEGDLRDYQEPQLWTSGLANIEAVVNASGALQTGLRDDLEAVQERAITALVSAAEAASVGKFVQISAAGAAEQTGPFMQTKAQADANLRASGLPYAILRPGLVIGRNAFGGTELLRTAAGLPLLGVEISGTGAIQCIALADVTDAAARALEEMEGEFDLVEAEGRRLGEVISLHRQWLGFPKARWTVRIRAGWLQPVSRFVDLLGWLGWRSPLRSNSVSALVQGVRGDPGQTRAALGREPLSLPEMLAAIGSAGKADRWHARLAAVYPLALATLMILWLAGGLIGLERIDEAAALLVEGGISAGTARAMVVAGALADLVIAAGILFRPYLRLALGGGALLATCYAVGAAVVRPDLWLDPLGSMVKILCVLALCVLCLAMAEER